MGLKEEEVAGGLYLPEPGRVELFEPLVSCLLSSKIAEKTWERPPCDCVPKPVAPEAECTLDRGFTIVIGRSSSVK